MRRALILTLALGCRSDDKTSDTQAGGGDDTSVTSVDGDGDGVPEDDDCDDGDASVSPEAEEVPYDGVDNDCDPDTLDDDLDQDGFEVAVDCDDTDGAVHPSATEVCNGTDDDCDGVIDDSSGDLWYADTDGDGFGDPLVSTQSCDGLSGTVADATDCDDTDADTWPGADETCDERDNDCDDTVDEGVTSTFFADTDGDGWGVSETTVDACSTPTGFADQAGDCDDADATVSPWATEVCDGVDNDCDGDTDTGAADAATWYDDTDGDGYGDPGAPSQSCTQPTGAVADDTDCDDTDGALSPDTVWYVDYDGDSYGAAVVTTTSCLQPTGFVADTSDCDDTDADVFPGATEVCNDVDDDCDGDIDDDDGGLDTSTALTWYADVDGDGFGDPAVTASYCVAPSGWVDDDTDCDDGEAEAWTGNVEVCDGVDNDCDGTADNGALGGDATCAASSCAAVLADGSSSGDGLYWLDPDQDGDTSDAWEAWCDMTMDGGGWTRLYSSHYPTWWSSTDWTSVGGATDDDYSILAERAEFADSAGVYTLRFEVGNSGTWDTGTRAHYTIWDQSHDPFSDTTDGSDYVYIAGDESTTCGGFNGLHNRYYTGAGVYCMSSDVDSGDSVGCWWMQLVPLLQYGGYAGYLEGYGGPNSHTWHTLWAR
jgi:hypothetical protein